MMPVLVEFGREEEPSGPRRIGEQRVAHAAEERSTPQEEEPMTRSIDTTAGAKLYVVLRRREGLPGSLGRVKAAAVHRPISIAFLLVAAACGSDFVPAPADHLQADGGTDADADPGTVKPPPPPDCDGNKTPKEDACVIHESFGVFVAPDGNDAGDGSRKTPFKTVARAVTAGKASGRRVYVCAATYAEPIRLAAAHGGARVFGGMSCGDWQYTGALAKFAPSSGRALELKSVTTASFEDIELVAADASSSGESSIAVLAALSTDVRFTRVKITAGKGMAGAPGADVAAYGSAAAKGNDAQYPDYGGAAKTCACTGAAPSVGGKGYWTPENPVTPGGPPEAGQPAMAGSGSPGTVNQSTNACTSGGTGGSGADGAVGAGASKWATLTADDWVSSAGAPGGAGGTGQGGGGGGGWRRAVTSDLIGHSAGGSGGCGGCGGAPGGAGKGGGSSLAVLSMQSSLDFVACTLQTSDAGAGGRGGGGQPGQGGGDGGAGNSQNGVSPICGGGAGGRGGHGGGGGGGAGGVSIGVAYTGKVPTKDAATKITLGAFGAGGAGGTSSGNAGTKGLDGVAEQMHAIP
jgi:hypothetical protein